MFTRPRFSRARLGATNYGAMRRVSLRGLRGRRRRSSRVTSSALGGTTLRPQTTEIKCLDLVACGAANTTLNREARYTPTAPITYSATGDPVGTVTPAFHLNLLQAGTANNQRIGNRIVMTMLDLKVRAFVDPVSSGQVANSLRVVLVYDTANNGTQPAFADVFGNNTQKTDGSADSTFTTFTARENPANRTRFKVLLDKSCVIGPASTSTATNQIHPIFRVKKRLRLPTFYAPPVTPVGNPSYTQVKTGLLSLFVVWEYPGPAMTTYCDVSSRLTYVDL